MKTVSKTLREICFSISTYVGPEFNNFPKSFADLELAATGFKS